MLHTHSANRFVLVEKVGTGGFGNVVIACDQRAQGKRVAVKTAADASPKHYVQVKNELQVNWRVLQRLDWTKENNIVRFLDAVDVHDAHNPHSLPQLVFEEAEGWSVCDKLCRDLKSYVTACTNEGLTISWEVQVKQWAVQLSNGLQNLHKLAIVHLDIKPANVLLCRNGRNNVLKICDMASAQMDGQTLEQIACTPNYTAPEVFDPHHRPFTYACDLWSLGATLFFLLEGQAPFQAESVASVQRRIQNCDYTLGWKVPAEAKRLISSLLQPEPDKRMSLSVLMENLGVDNTSPTVAMSSVQLKPDPLNTTGLLPKKLQWGPDKVVEITRGGEATITDKKKGRQVTVSGNGQRVLFMKPSGEVKQYSYQSLPARLYGPYSVLEHVVAHERAHSVIAKQYFSDSSAELLHNSTLIVRKRNGAGKMVERIIIRPDKSVEIGRGEKKRKLGSLQEAMPVLGEAECSKLCHLFDTLTEDVRIWRERDRVLPVVSGKRPRSW